MPAPIRAHYKIAQTGQPEGHSKKATLLWGPAHTLKTTSAMTWPSPFFLYFDPDTQTLETAKTSIPFIHVPDIETLNALGEDVRYGRMTEIIRAHDGFEDYTVKTIVVDGASALGRLVDTKLEADGLIGIPQWTKKKQILHKFFLNLVAGARWEKDREQYYIVCTAHEEVKTDPKAGTIATTAISGAFGKEIFPYFSDILLTRKAPGQKPKFYARTNPPSAIYESVGMRAIQPPPDVLDKGATYPELARYWYASKENTNG